MSVNSTVPANFLLAENPAGFQADFLAKNCAHPIEVVLPGGSGRAMARCGSRLVEKCPSCADRYRQDWKQILGTGILPLKDSDAPGGKISPDTFAGQTFAFLTLTAPSFGACHRVPRQGSKKPQRCGCGQIHHPEEHGLRGVPLDFNSFNYDALVAWNNRLPKLWDATRAVLQQVEPQASFAVVREWQARGALHLHILLRIPSKPGNEKFRVQALLKRLKQTQTCQLTGTRNAGFDGEYSYDIEMRSFGWGPQADAQVLNAGSPSAAARVGYLAKVLTYSVKSLTGFLNRNRLASPLIADHQTRLHQAAENLVCSCCDLDERRPHSWHAPKVCSSRAHSNWGASSHLLSISRGGKNHPSWSVIGLTRKRQRERRIAWVRAQGLAPKPFVEQYRFGQIASAVNLVHQQGLVLQPKFWTEVQDPLVKPWPLALRALQDPQLSSPSS